MFPDLRFRRVVVPALLFFLGPVGTVAQVTGKPNYEAYDFKVVVPKTAAGANFTLLSVNGMTVDASGNVYVSDFGQQIVCKIAPDGVTTVVAQGTASTLRLPRGLAAGAANTLFVANRGGVIESISAAGAVTAVAGSYGNPDWVDGTGAAARFYAPEALALDPAGNIFVTDAGNNLVRKITPAGVVSTFAGQPYRSGSQNGPALAATFFDLSGIVVDAGGTIFLIDGGAVRRIANGVVTSVAGVSGSGTTDGLGAVAQFRAPRALAMDPGGNLFVADTGNGSIRKITPAGVVTTLAGETTVTFSTEGSGPSAHLVRPSAIAVGADGRVYVIEAGNGFTVLRVGAPAGTFFEPNDDFVNRAPLVGNSVTATGSNLRAKVEVGESTHYDTTASHSVWWTWTAPNFGHLTVSTAGSSFDTVLAIYTGGDVKHLQAIGGDDESGGKGTSQASIFVTPGVSYAIAVDGYNGATGSIALQATFTPSAEVFATNFDSYPAGANSPLGLDGWVGSNFRDGVIAVVAGGTGGQQARIGGMPTADAAVEIWRPLNFDPVAAGTPLVEFTADVTITTATFGMPDNFYFVIHDLNANVLAALNFDAAAQELYRYDGVQFYLVGKFATGTRYPLKFAMDFAKNRWTVTLGAATIFADAPLTATGRPVSLGDVSALWQVTVKGSPGDNAMLFDNYRVALSGSIPTIVAGPADLTVAPGRSLYLTVTAEGAGLSYQWFKDGAVLAGATLASYSVAAASAADAGSYTVKVSDAARSLVSAPAVVTVLATPDVGRLINLSVRTHAGSGSGVLLAGVVVGGSGTGGTKPLLIRAVGPTLAAYGVGGALANPALELIDQTSHTVAAANDDWQGDAQVVAIGNQVGAFSLASAASKDAALLVAPGGGSYAVRILGGVNPLSDITLAEVYDATPPASYVATSPRLVNVSARAQVDTGDGILIAGFVVGGSTARTVMIRGIGPTLSGYGVGGALADPQLQLYQRVNGSDRLVAANDDWGLAPNANLLAAVAAQVGAFSLQPGTRDAVLLLTLPPGIYSAQLSGVGGTVGVGLLEVYEVP